MSEISISQSWSGSGKHDVFRNRTDWFDVTNISEDRTASTATSVFKLDNYVSYPGPLSVFRYDQYSNQTYTLKLGSVTRTGTIPNHNENWDYPTGTKVDLPNLTYTVQHKGAISVPYSLSYSATAKVDQNESYQGDPNYRTFTVTVTYSGYFYSEGFVKTYGSVGGVSKKIKKLYCSVNGKSRRITKLYGSVNGKSKRIF